jgi:hypothetical protein
MYYKLLISSIYTAQNNGFMSDVWKILSNFYMAVAISCNILIIFIIINNHVSPKLLNFLIIDFSTIGKCNFLLNIFVVLILPIMLFNYFSIFRNNSYKKLIKKYPTFYKKKPFVIYFMISILIPILYVLLQVEIRL